MIVLGGIQLITYNSTRSWGVNPASGSGDAVGGSTPVGVGDYVAWQFGGNVFYGIVSEFSQSYDHNNGMLDRFSIVDNRIRLQWSTICGIWNMPEDGYQGRGSGSLSEGCRYWHILPEDWDKQIRTYTDQPMSAADMMTSALTGMWGSYSFGSSYHSMMHSNYLTGVDVNDGSTLSNFISMVNNAMGLDMTIDGNNGLRWDKRGGSVFVGNSTNGYVSDTGSSMSRESNRVRVIGGRNLMQVMNVNLHPDWEEAWNVFLSEVAWIDEVDSRFGPYPDTASGAAERAAKAREVTVGEYAAIAGDQFKDRRMFGHASRMDMSAWVYINEFIFKSYRILPDAVLLDTYPLHSLEMRPGLLREVANTPEGVMSYKPGADSIYPSANAYVIAKGQPLDLMDRGSYEVFAAKDTDLGNVFSPVSDFDLDVERNAVKFANPIFQTGSTGLFLRINRGEGGGNDVSGDPNLSGSDILDIVVPNPNYVVSAAEVKLSVVFAVDKFYKDFGTGRRRKVHSAPEINKHLLHTGGSSFVEIPYAGGKLAEDLAHDISESLIERQDDELSGTYTRIGAAGASLTSGLDRISITVNQSEGLVETVGFAKPIPTSGFVSDREMEQRQRNEELYPGQRDNKREIEQLRWMSKLLTSEKRKGQDTSYTHIKNVFQRPVGDEHASIRAVNMNAVAPSSGSWQAGHVVWMEGTSVNNDGPRFGGIVVVGGNSAVPKSLNCAVNGVVPCKVQGPFKGGDTVGCDAGENILKVGGAKEVGRILHEGIDYTGSQIILVNVRLGAASSEVCLLGGLSPDPESIIEGAQKILEGFITGGGTSIFLEKGDIIPVIDDWLWVEVSWTGVEEDGVLLEGGTMTAAVIVQGSSLPTDVKPAVGSLSGTAYVPLGKWISNGAVEPLPVWKRWGCGSIIIKFCPSGGFYYLRGEVSGEATPPPYYYYY